MLSISIQCLPGTALQTCEHDFDGLRRQLLTAGGEVVLRQVPHELRAPALQERHTALDERFLGTTSESMSLEFCYVPTEKKWSKGTFWQI